MSQGLPRPCFHGRALLPTPRRNHGARPASTAARDELLMQDDADRSLSTTAPTEAYFGRRRGKWWQLADGQCPTAVGGPCAMTYAYKDDGPRHARTDMSSGSRAQTFEWLQVAAGGGCRLGVVVEGPRVRRWNLGRLPQLRSRLVAHVLTAQTTPVMGRLASFS